MSSPIPPDPADASNEDGADVGTDDGATRRPYRKPRLVAHGRLAELTRSVGLGPRFDNPGMAKPMKTGL